MVAFHRRNWINRLPNRFITFDFEAAGTAYSYKRDRQADWYGVYGGLTKPPLICTGAEAAHDQGWNSDHFNSIIAANDLR